MTDLDAGTCDWAVENDQRGAAEFDSITPDESYDPSICSDPLSLHTVSPVTIDPGPDPTWRFPSQANELLSPEQEKVKTAPTTHNVWTGHSPNTDTSWRV